MKCVFCVWWCCLVVAACAVAADVKPQLNTFVESEYPRLFELYRQLHQHPELSFHETNTARILAQNLRDAGFEVTEHVGGFGVVGVLRNGAGPTVLIRTDLDGLPVKEETKLPFASKALAIDDDGKEVPLMHACGHDIHITCMVGVTRALSRLTNDWRGTLVAIGQPAEERGSGARAMLKDGLFEKFPKPNFCLALHDDAELPAGVVGWTSGFGMANVDSVDITVRGVGGHGAYPHKTRDPIVLASRIVLALQTIVSREVRPGEPAVITVGSIHGGAKHNVIPDEVRLQLTVRSYTDATRNKLLDGISRIARGEAIAAGLSESQLPLVKVADEHTPAAYNDPALTARLVKVFRDFFGADKVVEKEPSMGGEDFGELGRTADKIPICLFRIGGVRHEDWQKSLAAGSSLPSLHSSLWAPDPEPTIKTGIGAMTAAVLELQSAAAVKK